MSMEKTFNLARREDGIAILTMDVPGETMNTLKAEFGPEITEILAEIKADSSIKGLVVTSGKADSFVAGADITMLAACKSEADAKALSQQGHVVFSELEGLPLPPVEAAISGNKVIGYTGEGGKEYWKKPIFTEVKSSEIKNFCKLILSNLKEENFLKKSSSQRKKLSNMFSLKEEHNAITKFLKKI